MLKQLADRLTDAHTRLRAALIDGIDTTAHRAAIEQIESDISAEHLRKRRANIESEANRSTNISRRTHVLVNAVQQHIDGTLQRFPIPRLS